MPAHSINKDAPDHHMRGEKIMALAKRVARDPTPTAVAMFVETAIQDCRAIVTDTYSQRIGADQEVWHMAEFHVRTSVLRRIASGKLAGEEARRVCAALDALTRGKTFQRGFS